MLEKLDLKRSTYYYNLSHPKPDRYADVRPLVREAFSRTANGVGYRQIALALRMYSSIDKPTLGTLT